MIRTHVLICGGTGCTSSGSVKIAAAMEEESKEEKEGRRKPNYMADYCV